MRISRPNVKSDGTELTEQSERGSLSEIATHDFFGLEVEVTEAMRWKELLDHRHSQSHHLILARRYLPNERGH